MNTFLVVTLLCVLAYSSGDTPEWSSSEGNIPDAICGKGMTLEWVSFSPCTSYPCSVKAGSKLTIRIRGRFAANAEMLKGEINFTVGSTVISEIQYDPCQGTFKCPVSKGVLTPANGTVIIPKLENVKDQTSFIMVHQLRNERGEEASCLQFKFNYMP